jgi:hypothetical protein
MQREISNHRQFNRVISMNKAKLLIRVLLFLSVVSNLLAAQAYAAIPGDIDADNKIDLVEAIYALRVASQSTGNSFTPSLLAGKTFFQIEANSTGGETCIIESQVVGNTIEAKEWLYINDDHWTLGCQEEYVPGETGSFPYTIEEGVLKLDLGGEIWPTHLVEAFEESYLTSNPDGIATWYFTRDKVNALLDPSAKFTQALLSANPWYPLEVAPQDPTHPDCNGTFTFDGKITLTVGYDDNGVLVQATGQYLVHEGNLSTCHDGKCETDTIQSFEGATIDQATKITAIKTVLRSDGSSEGTGTKRIYFKIKQDLIDYLAALGLPSCFL